MNPTRVLRKPFRYTFINATFFIIGINVLVFFLTSRNTNFLSYLSLNVKNVVNSHAYWQFFSYMFVHGSFTHILCNMLGLFFFGIPVERAIGSKEFILLYCLSGFVCGLISFVIYYFTGAYSVFLMGASGAVYAVLLTYAVVFPKAQIFIWGVLPIPAPILVLVYTIIEVVSQLLSFNSGIAHMTHLVGFAFAWLYIVIRMGIHPWRIWKNNYR